MSCKPPFLLLFVSFLKLQVKFFSGYTKPASFPVSSHFSLMFLFYIYIQALCMGLY